jgi:peptidoglycan/LPS O-acetylase OafA/YrhL
MTATTTLTAPSVRRQTTPTTPTTPTTQPGTKKVWKTGAAAGLAASVATSGFAAMAHALDVSLKVSGEAIPLAGFAQLTFIAAIIGTVLALVLSRRARRPRHTFVTTTLALTALSVVPDVLADAQTATRVTLALTHVIAAAIIIPALASRLSD